MKTRILASGGIAILVAIVVTAIVVANPFSTHAAPNDDDGDKDTKPYIGVVIHTLSDGSVKVVKVIEGGPADGVLEDGDIITAVSGEKIDGAKDLVQAVADAGAGASLTLTITRDDSGMDVSVTVGEMEVRERRKGGKFHKRWKMSDRFASSRIVMADDDGNYHAYRTVAGDITDLDADAGTFTLRPKDGSDPIAYAISDDTRIYADGEMADDLSGLDADAQAVVMDIDGEVKVVKQVDEDAMGGYGYRKDRIYKFGPGGASHHSFFQPRDSGTIRIEIKRLGNGDSF